MELLLAFILAMVLTMALIPPLMRYAGTLHVLDTPGGRKAHGVPIPRIGGIAMVAGAALPLALWLEVDRLSLAYLASLLIVVGFGVWDDRADLPPWAKLAGQVLAVAIVVLLGGVEIHSVTFAARHELPSLVAVPLTMLFLLGITNAINLSDGLDGLAGGTTFLCCAAIAALSLGSDMAFVTTLAVVVMGSLLGFLRYNTHPASVFMGDGGSQFLGFTVGVLAVLLTQHEALPYSAAMPLLLLGLPILDTLTVMALRIREGRSPFAADRKHLHHRLLALGFDHFEAVAVIYVLQGTLFLLAWWLRFHSDATILATFAAFAAALLRSSGRDASCGCFGEASAPVTGVHVAVNVVAAAVAAAAIAAPVVPFVDAVGELGWEAPAFVLLVLVGGGLVRAALTVGAELQLAMGELRSAQ